MNAIFRFENGDVVDAPTNVRDGHPVPTVMWSTGETFWLDVPKYRDFRKVVYNQVPDSSGPDRSADPDRK